MTPSKRNKKHENGFTLIEVLAALIVFSIAILGLSQAGSQSVRSVGILENRMLAGIVADNVLVLARSREVVVGTQTGEQAQMRRNFDWELETVATDVPGFLRLTVNVSERDSSQIIMTRTAFYSRLKDLPVPIATPSDDSGTDTGDGQ